MGGGLIVGLDDRAGAFLDDSFAEFETGHFLFEDGEISLVPVGFGALHAFEEAFLSRGFELLIEKSPGQCDARGDFQIGEFGFHEGVNGFLQEGRGFGLAAGEREFAPGGDEDLFEIRLGTVG